MAEDKSPAPPGGYGSLPTHDEREERYLTVEEMLYRRLLSTSTIERDLAVAYGITSRTVRSYISYVRKRTARRERVEQAPRIDRGMVTEALVDRYNDCIGKGDNKTAVRCLHEIAMLHGLMIRRIELTGADGGPLKVKPEDAAKLLGEQLDRVLGAQRGEAPAPTPTTPGSDGAPSGGEHGP